MQYVHQWADLASILGVLLSLIGFAVTITAVYKSKSAAEQANRASTDVRQKLAIQSAVVDLNRILADIEELKPLHRAEAWELLPPRYASLRRQLLTLKSTFTPLSKAQSASIQGTIQQFRTIEQIVESALQEGGSPPDIPALNKIAAECVFRAMPISVPN